MAAVATTRQAIPCLALAFEKAEQAAEAVLCVSHVCGAMHCEMVPWKLHWGRVCGSCGVLVELLATGWL